MGVTTEDRWATPSPGRASSVQYCECGCGEPTNLVWLRVLDLRDDGLTSREIAPRVGLSPSYVKVLAPKAVRGEWPRFKLGHQSSLASSLPRKRCEFGRCPNTVPANWHYCTDQRCQSARAAVRWGLARTRSQALRRIDNRAARRAAEDHNRAARRRLIRQWQSAVRRIERLEARWERWPAPVAARRLRESIAASRQEAWRLRVLASPGLSDWLAVTIGDAGASSASTSEPGKSSREL